MDPTMDESGSVQGATEIDSISSSLERTSHEPVTSEQVSLSAFGDSSCGEPLVAQHLVFDFTPLTDTIDNEVAQKKCCAFWDYINSRQDLQGLMVMPETDDISYYDDNVEKLIAKDPSQKKEISKEKTAVSMLEFVEDKGLIDRIFEAKMQQSHCTLGSREYHENEPTKPAKKRKEEKTTCTCTTVCKTCRNVPKRSAEKPAPPAAVQDLCQKLEEWDAQHPKSMSPPGHPPALSHSIMQRKVTM